MKTDRKAFPDVWAFIVFGAAIAIFIFSISLIQDFGSLSEGKPRDEWWGANIGKEETPWFILTKLATGVGGLIGLAGVWLQFMQWNIARDKTNENRKRELQNIEKEILERKETRFIETSQLFVAEDETTISLAIGRMFSHIQIYGWTNAMEFSALIFDRILQPLHEQYRTAVSIARSNPNFSQDDMPSTPMSFFRLVQAIGTLSAALAEKGIRHSESDHHHFYQGCYFGKRVFMPRGKAVTYDLCIFSDVTIAKQRIAMENEIRLAGSAVFQDCVFLSTTIIFSRLGETRQIVRFQNCTFEGSALRVIRRDEDGSEHDVPVDTPQADNNVGDVPNREFTF